MCIPHALIHSRIANLLAEALTMRHERVGAPLPKSRVPHAKDVPVLLNDHQLSNRSLLIAPDHERQAVAVGEEAVGNTRLQAGDLPRVLVLRKAQELDLAPEDLGPAEVLREAK